MKKLFLILLFAIAFYRSEAQKKSLTIIRSVSIIPMTSSLESIEHNRDVYIQDGIISKITTASRSYPKNTLVIDGTGKYLLPGMIDMHAHLPRADDTFSTRDFLLLNLLNGITTLRQMRGEFQDLVLRDSIRKNLLIGGDIFVSSPYFRNGKTFTSKACLDSLIKFKKDGFDFLKYLYGLTDAQYDTLNSMAYKLGFKLTGHTPPGGLKKAVESKQWSIEHTDPFIKLYQKDSIDFWNTIDKMSEYHLFACPDLKWYDVQGSHKALKDKLAQYGNQYWSSQTKERLEKTEKEWILDEALKNPGSFAQLIRNDQSDIDIYRRLLPRLHNKGIPLLISAGAGDFILPGFAYVDELLNFSSSGISNYATLRCATYNAAECLGQLNTIGTIEPGKRADMILLTANPLTTMENIKMIDMIVLRGKTFTPAELEKMIKEK
jgi:Amidohydrolase family